MLAVRLLGQFRVELDGTPIQIASRPAQSLFALLALTAGIEHRREKLAGALWPDSFEENARANLRHALWRIRSAIERAGGDSEEFIVANGIGASFNPRASYWLDAREVEQAARSQNGSAAELARVALLYVDELLPGFYDEWTTPHRARLQAAFDELMGKAASRLQAEHLWQELITLCRHWLAYGDSHESAFQHLMVAHYALGDIASVQACFRECEAALADSIGAEPSQEAHQLFVALKSGAYAIPPISKPTESNSPPARTPAAGPAPAPPTNLPAPATPLVGRAADLAGIAALLADPACRLITLLGPGGVGKTRLAIQAAALAGRDAPPQFADGVFFIPLEAVTSVEGVIAAVSDAVRHMPFGQQPLRAQVLDFLREKRILLVMDNFEHLLPSSAEAAVFVEEIIDAAPGVKTIVTSRERLHAQREHLVEVDGLDYPADDDAGDLDRHGAVQLFVQTARRIYSRFSLDTERAGVARICRLTEGMPLAIELAAAWVRALSCHEIAARIAQNLDVLTTTDPDLPPRHRGVRAVLDYSWQLLASAERNAFAALSVFRAGFELDAAEDVARISMSMLFTLVDKSLLRRTPAGRYEMHDLVRRYGEEKLDAIEDEDYSPDTVHARMARYYLQYAERFGKDYTRLEPEWVNFLAAMRAAHERYEWPAVTRMAEMLSDAWFTRARFTDAREGLKLASEAAAADDDLRALAIVLRWRGRACIEQGDYEEATQLLEAGMSVAEQVGDSACIAAIEHSQAWIALELSDHDKAMALLELNITRRERLGDQAGLADALFSLMRLKYRQDLDDEAYVLALRVLRLQEAQADKRSSIPTLRYLGLIEHARGDSAQAIAHCEQALALAEECHDQGELASAFYALSQITRRSGDLLMAQKHAEASIRLLAHMGDRKSLAILRLQLGIVLHELHEDERALMELQRSLSLFEELKEKWTVVHTLQVLGDVHTSLHQTAAAIDAWKRGLTIAQTVNHPRLEDLQKRLAAG